MHWFWSRCITFALFDIATQLTRIEKHMRERRRKP